MTSMGRFFRALSNKPTESERPLDLGRAMQSESVREAQRHDLSLAANAVDHEHIHCGRCYVCRCPRATTPPVWRVTASIVRTTASSYTGRRRADMTTNGPRNALWRSSSAGRFFR